MRNRSSTGVLSSPAPHLAGEFQSSLCMNSMQVCTKRDLILLFVVVVVVYKDHFRGYFLQPPPTTPLAGGFQSSLLFVICTKIMLFICALEWPVPCTLHHVHRISYHIPSTPCPVPRTSYLVPLTLYLVPCTSYSVPLAQHPLPHIDIFLGLVRFVG